jgi:hypothetical protein
VKETEDVPLDMALDLGFDTTFINGSNLSELTFSVILSKGFPLTERGYKVSPYGGIEMSTVYGSYAPKNDTDVLGFAGVEWKVSQKFILYGEAKLGDDFLGHGLAGEIEPRTEDLIRHAASPRKHRGRLPARPFAGLHNRGHARSRSSRTPLKRGS